MFICKEELDWLNIYYTMCYTYSTLKTTSLLDNVDYYPPCMGFSTQLLLVAMAMGYNIN